MPVGRGVLACRGQSPPGQATGKAPAEPRAEAPAEARSEAPAEAPGKAPDKASADELDPEHAEPGAEAPGLPRAEPEAEAPDPRLAEPNHEPTNQETSVGPEAWLFEPPREPPTGGGVTDFPSLTRTPARDIIHFHPW